VKPGIVIILFHPDLTHLNKVLSGIEAENLPIILVDNSPEPLVDTFSTEITYLHFPSNIGIAAAQNAGIKVLIECGCSHIALFDQDSDITSALLTGLCDGFSKAQQSMENIAAVGPQIVCEFNAEAVSPAIQRERKISEDFASVKQIIASGMLLNADIFKTVGEKEESLFIDGVDHEWCWRARDKGYQIVKLLNVKMLHRQGDGRKKILGLTFKRGAPIRLYYQARNILILSRRDYVPLYWKCRNLMGLPVRWLINRWVFEQGKIRGRFFLKGLKDGVKGKTGALD